ncbi:hypothetical protein EIN_339130 [Entamoeba invadens IP1]|uniref:MULE transposase domain-containing protein n=1 Tax=Entamoeba invadens IP1 TaxID=370355 RepID=A0A0A1U765_ENTIV|nr:hypothetical protein EIN_339130 [Entamoeba invadens IP1]ELP90252.1 hypothetical protein EIN_339130 [Entamoeba invadens IP1]|eukprot:XP_004257023.1 hypothetical protein EIN_339130 [Entamoeba invadens IP1]
MEKRTECAYTSLFTNLKVKQGVIITKFMSDFELSCRNAIIMVYKEVTLLGCWFHFKQAIFKKVSKLGLSKIYTIETKVNTFIRSLFALPFLRPQEIVETVQELFETIDTIDTSEVNKDKLKLLMTYFNKVWIVRYPPPEWNQSLDLLMKTNNWSESFHSSFSRKFYRTHPNAFVLVEKLKEVERKVEVDFNSFINGKLKKQTNNYYNKYNEELSELLTKRMNLFGNNKLLFLEKVATIPLKIIISLKKDMVNQKVDVIDDVQNVLNETSIRDVEEIDSLISDVVDEPDFKMGIFNHSNIEITECSKEKQFNKMKILTKMKIKKRIQEIQKITHNSQKPRKRITVKLNSKDIENIVSELDNISGIPFIQTMESSTVHFNKECQTIESSSLINSSVTNMDDSKSELSSKKKRKTTIIGKLRKMT